MNKEELESHIARLNNWLKENRRKEGSLDFKLKLHARNWFVNRLIILEEYGFAQ